HTTKNSANTRCWRSPISLFSSHRLVGRDRHRRLPMSSEANKDVIRGWMRDVLNGHDIDAIEKYFAPGCVHHDPEMGETQGIEAETQLTSTFVAGFPDLAFTLEISLA